MIVTLTLNPAVDISTALPRLAPAHKLRCGPERRDAGGGGINVARVISRLGGEVSAIFPAGGPIGDYLRRLVREEGVHDHVVPIAGITRENITVHEVETQNEYRFVLPGPALSAAEFDACIAALAEVKASIVIASGSLPPGVPEDAYARLAAATKAQGAKFVLDAAGAPLRHALEEGVYLIKPNLRELRELTGAALEDETATARAAHSLVHAGKADIVALSRGDQGALLIARNEAWTAPAVQVPVASSVGAGDSFLAGFIWSLTHGETLQDAFRIALASGAATLLQPGTTLGTKADIERLAPLAAPRPLSMGI